MLAAKASLCVRVDALGEEADRGLGLASRAMVEERVRQCEQEQLRRISGTGKARAQAEKYQPKRWEWHTEYTQYCIYMHCVVPVWGVLYPQ